MNTLWLRRLIRKHDTLGHIVAGFYLLGHYLLVRRRNLTLSALVVTCAASAAAISLLHRSASRPAYDGQLFAGPTAYKIVDLGALRGAEFMVPYGVNSDNQVVGLAVMENDTFRAFLWQNGKVQDLGALGGQEAVANGINDRGQVTGTALTADGTAHAFIWQDGKMRDLTPERGSYSFAGGINDRGQVVGTSYNGKEDVFRAVLWTDGKQKEIGVLPGDNESIGVAVNAKGEAVGDSTPDLDSWRPFISRGSSPELIATPTGAGYVTGINVAGQVVGMVEQGENIRAYTTINGRSALLPTLGGEDNIALAVNNSGIAIGLTTTRGDDLRACGWQNGRAVDLNSLLPANSGWQLLFAFGIGNKNQIVGIGIHNRELRAFLLAPDGRG
jgi:probable HAF family extracellular repeat protein